MTLVPTLNRLKLLNRFLKSAEDCETSTPIRIIVDEADWKANFIEYESLKKSFDFNKKFDFVFWITKSVKMGDKIREVWPKVKASGCKWVNILNDDHEIKTKGWDIKLASRLDGTNFVTCQDGWMSPHKAAGATMFSMKLLETVGFPIYPPGMIHLFIDDLWESIGKGTGVWDIDHSVRIEHHNQLKTPNERDSTFHAVYGKTENIQDAELWKNDEKVYQDFMKNDYMAIRNKIRKLRGQLELIYNA